MMSDNDWKIRFYQHIDKQSREYNTINRKFNNMEVNLKDEFWRDAEDLYHTRKDIGRISKEFVNKVFAFRTKWYFLKEMIINE